MDEISGDEITVDWANSTYPHYSHYGEDLPEFTEDDIAIIRDMVECGNVVFFEPRSS